MRIDIISLFPEFIKAFYDHSIVKRARGANLLELSVTNPRDFTHDRHHMVDDTPYGGGNGMLMKAEPVFLATEYVCLDVPKRRIVLLCPTGKQFTQEKAKELAQYDQLIFICGHYEGIDYRVEKHLADETISIGDYVLTGGELPAMVVVDAVARMIPGVLGAAGGAAGDSFYVPLLEYPQYTKPVEFRGHRVPEVLFSGHHKNIEEWHHRESLRRTWLKRPDLLEKQTLSSSDAKLIEKWEKER